MRLSAISIRRKFRRLGEEHPLASPLGVVDHEAASDPLSNDLEPIEAGISNSSFAFPFVQKMVESVSLPLTMWVIPLLVGGDVQVPWLFHSPRVEGFGLGR